MRAGDAFQRAVHLGDDAGHKQRGGAGQPAADHHEPIDQRDGVGQGVADALAQCVEGPRGGRLIAGRLALGNLENLLGRGR